MNKKKHTIKKTIEKICDLMLDKKAFDIKIINVKNLTSLTDYFIVCSSGSAPQTKAITNHIRDELISCDLKPSNIEGYENLKWVLIDYVNIIIHVFDKESRDYYSFERLWADGEIKTVE